MTNPFSLIDIPIAALILFAIVAPERFIHLTKVPEDKRAVYLPRIRPLAIGALILFVAGRFLMAHFIPQFQQLNRW